MNRDPLRTHIARMSGTRVSPDTRGWRAGPGRRGDAGMRREGMPVGSLFPMTHPSPSIASRTSIMNALNNIQYTKSPGQTGTEQLATYALMSKIMPDGTTHHYTQGDCLFVFVGKVTDRKYITMDPFKMNDIMRRDTQEYKRKLIRRIQQTNGGEVRESRKRKRDDEARGEQNDENYMATCQSEWQDKFRFGGIVMSPAPPPDFTSQTDPLTRLFTMGLGIRIFGVANVFGNCRVYDKVGFNVTKRTESRRFQPPPTPDDFQPLQLVPTVCRYSRKPYVESDRTPIDETIAAVGGENNLSCCISSQRMLLGLRQACFMNHTKREVKKGNRRNYTKTTYKDPRDLGYRDVFYVQVRVKDKLQWRQCHTYEISHHIPVGTVKLVNGSTPSAVELERALSEISDVQQARLKMHGTLDLITNYCA